MCSLYRVGTIATAYSVLSGRCYARCAVAMLCLLAATSAAFAQLPTVSFVETQINVAHNAPTATLRITTSGALQTPQGVEILIVAGSVSMSRIIDVPTTANAEAALDIMITDFDAARKSDGSLEIQAKINPPRNDVQPFLFSNTNAIISVAARPAPPESGQLTLTKSVEIGRNPTVGEFRFQITGAVTRSIERGPTTQNAELRRPITTGPIRIPANGTVTVADQAPTGFRFTAVSCTIGGAPHATSPVVGHQFDVTIPAGETVACTVNNPAATAVATPAPVARPAAPTNPPVAPASPPTLTLQALSTDRVGTFQFTVRHGGRTQPVTITTTAPNAITQAAAMALSSGQVVITQATVAGFTLVDASCTLGAAPHPNTVNVDARTIGLEMPASGNVTCTITNGGTAARAKTVESRFVKRRAQQLTSHIGQTRRSAGRFSGGRTQSGGLDVSGAGTDGQGHVNMRSNLSRLGGALDPQSATAKAAKLGVKASDYGVDDRPAFRSGWDVWAEGSWSYHKVDGAKFGGLSSSGQFGVLRAGADYLINAKFLFGVVAQYDYLSDSSKLKTQGGYRIRGHGWLAGPYVEFALTDNLFFDAKALWGTSRNEISPDLTFTDRFSTTRWLASARLTGSWSWAHTPRSVVSFLPRAELVWFNENVAGYIDAKGIAVDGQDVHLGRFNIGPEFSYRHTMESGLIIEPRIGAQALLSLSHSRASAGDGLDSASRSSVKDTPLERFQMRFTAGLKIELPEGSRVELEGSYTGLGKYGHEALSGKVGFTIPLH